MKIRTALLLIPVLLALCAGTAAAKAPPPKSGVDPGFGHGGTIAVSVPKGAAEKSIQMAIAPSGKSYVLAGSTLLAFGASGRPDPGFGHNGRIQVAAAAGETTEVTGLAVDAQGRVLVSGSVNPTPGVRNEPVPREAGGGLLYPAPSNAFVVRLLSNGERDPSFGGAGEIDVTLTPPPRVSPPGVTAHFEHPSVSGDRLAVVNGETPVLGGSYVYYVDYCYLTGVRAYAFTAAIDPAGPAAQNIPPAGFTQFEGSDVTDLAPMTPGNLAVLSSGSGTCSDRGSPLLPTLSTVTFGGAAVPALDPARPRPALKSLAVDGKGRFLGVEGASPYTEPPWKLDRLLPSGAFDPAFGSNGGVPLPKFGDEPAGAVVVGANERPVVAGGESKFRLVRLGTKGKVDHSFGNHGWVEVGFGKGSKASPAALTINPKGRILAVGQVKSPALKTGEGIGLTRILPGS